MKWQLIIEEFSSELMRVKGSKNIVADALSRLDKKDNKNKNNDYNAKKTNFRK